MRRLFLLGALLAACARPQPTSQPQPQPQGPEPMVPFTSAQVAVYRYAGDVLAALQMRLDVTGVEQAGCVTRWNSVWQGDSLKLIELFTIVPLRAVIADSTQFVPDPAIGNCWWHLPSIHWHTEDGGPGPSEQDWAFAILSGAPFHIIMHKGEIRVYAIRPSVLRRNNPR